MNKIEIKEKYITIDNVDYPKGIFSIIAMNDRLRLDFVATTDKIDIFAPAEVNGIIYNSLADLRTVLSDEVFNLRWATSAEVSQMIAEAQLAGQEVDLSIYALKTQLNNYVLKSELSEFGSLKIWRGVVRSTDTENFFTVNFPSNTFTQPPTVMVTAISPEEASDTTTDNASWACVIKNSITKDGFRGRAKSANSAGLLAAMVAVNLETDVIILAIGV